MTRKLRILGSIVGVVLIEMLGNAVNGVLDAIELCVYFTTQVMKLPVNVARELPKEDCIILFE